MAAAAGSDLTYGDYPFLAELGITEDNKGCFNGEEWVGSGDVYTSLNPSNGRPIARIQQATPEEYEACIAAMDEGAREWAEMPAPARGEVIRQVGEALRAKLDALGQLISLEMGKISSEGRGEVQEFIDICDFAVGLSRSLNGQVIPSERPGHVLLERWNPLGKVGIVTAFNFPCAVLGWNLAISMAAGNTNIWKGATTTSLVTVAVTKVITDVFKANGVPKGVLTMVCGPGRTIGNRLVEDRRLSLISFTGSTAVGRNVSKTVAERFGSTILELGGNNATVVMPDADQDMALRASVFGAVGTAGQRCTSLRRLFIHRSIFDDFVAKLQRAYSTIEAGDPLDPKTLLGPVHTEAAVREYLEGIEEIKKQGGEILCGGKRIERPGCYVEPTIVKIDHDKEIVKTELFVPIMYVIPFDTLEEAISYNNEVPQGLSSSIFTRDMRNVFKWVGPSGSDTGLVNVNVGTSGAEIGGAFGGEKETGGGRESGSNAWQQYCRRSTCTINYSDSLPLAQGVEFV